MAWSRETRLEFLDQAKKWPFVINRRSDSTIEESHTLLENILHIRQLLNYRVQFLVRWDRPGRAVSTKTF